MNPNALRTAGKIQEWASVEQRQKLIQEIEMAMSQSGNPSMRSGLEIEGQIFQRARSKDDYFNLIARFILHLKEVRTPNNMSNVAQSQKGIIPQVFNIGTSQQGAYENQDQSSVQQLQTQQAQSQSQLLQAQNSLPLQQQIIQQASSGGTQLPSNVIGSVQNFSGQLINSAAIQSNTPLSLGGQSGTLSFVSGGQRIKQNEIAIPASVQMPSNLTSAASLQHLKQLQQRKLQNVQAQRGQPQQLISAAQIMPQHQHRQQQNSQQQQMALRAISSQSQTANQTSATTSQAQFLISTQQQQQHQQQQQQQQHQQQQQQQQQHQQQQQQQQQQHQQQQQKQPQVTVVQPKSQSTPSPQVQQNFQSRPMVSPAGSSIQIARSPLTNQVSPCPPSNSLNNPPSIGPPAQSPLGAVDEVAYADKLKELVKYIEPLGSLINKMSKGEEHAAKRNKLQHIYEVFTNKRRVTLAFLSKCEQVVQTLLSVATPAPSSVSDSAYIAKQSTLQTVTENLVPLASNPMLVTAADHCISPVLKCLSSATIRHPRPPRKRKRVATSTREEKKSCLPSSLQLEMAHLWTKYSFKTDDSLPQKNNFVTLSCKPKNCDVPSVPSIVLRVPANYPKQPPEYTISISDESLLLHSIKRTFLRKLLKSEVDQFQSITRILEAWEQSIQDSKS